MIQGACNVSMIKHGKQKVMGISPFLAFLPESVYIQKFKTFVGNGQLGM